MTSNFYVLSMRDVNNSPANCCAIEFEDVIVKSLDANLINSKDAHHLNNLRNNDSSANYLILAVITIHDVLHLLQSVNQYLSSFDGIYAYVFDAIINPYDLNKPIWKKVISKNNRAIKKLTHLFVPFKSSVNAFAEAYSIPVSYVPMASDVLEYGGYSQYKFIDINGYGRQNITYSNLISKAFNCRESKRIYHHTDHMHIGGINDIYAHRRFFWQVLRGSKIALAFDSMYANNNNRFNFSFVGQRWFESTAAGCVVLGKRPTCPEMNEIFDWDNSTIEVPESPADFLPFIEALLENETALTNIGIDNYIHALEKNDWRYRLLQILEVARIDPPSKLLSEILLLSDRKQFFVKSD